MKTDSVGSAPMRSRSAVRNLAALNLAATFLAFTPAATRGADQEATLSRDVRIRLGARQTITAIHWQPPEAPLAFDSPLAATPHPRPRLAGFSPLVAVATSNAGHPLGFDLEFAHELEDSYVGQSLNPFVFPQFVIGYLDSGADVMLAAGSAAARLGLTGANLTENTVDLSGVSGTDVAFITMPKAFFAAGLSAVTAPDTLNYTALKGHSNVAGLAAPPIDCGFGELVNALIGMPMLAFYKSAILVESPRTVTVSGRDYTSPEVKLLDPLDPDPTLTYDFTREVGVTLESLLIPFVTTANYYPDLVGFLDGPPIIPTILSAAPGLIPGGGAYYANILVREGDATPDNPSQTMKVLVDTGAQSSVITRNMAANLSLPLTPDFTIDVCGIGGLATNIPVYYVDYVRINAFGGAMEFSQAPFVLLNNLSGPGGIPIDGILGMNFFWNRNVMLVPDPSPTSAGALYLSDPIPFAYGDFDLSLKVASDDYELFEFCFAGPGAPLPPDCYHTDGDADGDLDLRDAAAFQRCFSGTAQADASCGP